MEAQIQILKPSHSIVHIPRDELYLYISPILQLLGRIRKENEDNNNEDSEDFEQDDLENLDSLDSLNNYKNYSNNYNYNLNEIDTDFNDSNDFNTNTNLNNDLSNCSLEENNEFNGNFVNISISPIECSIICPTVFIIEYFQPIIEKLKSFKMSNAYIFQDSYLVIQLDGGTVNGENQVLALSDPLAAAGVSIFFISTYFSDYVLAPLKAKSTVMKALESRGFKFSTLSNSFISSTNSFSLSESSITNNNKTDEDLCNKKINEPTNSLINNLSPIARKDVKLILTGSVSNNNNNNNNNYNNNFFLSLYDNLVNSPKYLSISIATDSSPSILLEQDVANKYFKNLLLGSLNDVLIPVTLDLSSFPQDLTGVVYSVASNLNIHDNRIPLSFLSTAKSGTVLVSQDDLSQVVKILNAKVV